MKTLLLTLSLLLASAALVVAQPAPAPAPAPAEATTAEGKSDANTQALVAFFETSVQTAEANKGDCAMMGGALNDLLNTNEPMLREVAYSSSVATTDEELAMMNAATQLGELAGACYQEPTVVNFFDRLVKLTGQLAEAG